MISAVGRLLSYGGFRLLNPLPGSSELLWKSDAIIFKFIFASKCLPPQIEDICMSIPYNWLKKKKKAGAFDKSLHVQYTLNPPPLNRLLWVSVMVGDEGH